MGAIVNGVHYQSDRGRYKKNDNDVIDHVFTMRGKRGVNGENIDLLLKSVGDLINTVNKQQVKINELENKS